MKLWYVHKYIDTHNHELARPNEVYFLYLLRKITEVKG
uniref:FAR1 domain-containing protein n=1 Tax=Arundo donax TaxID=35708 RepID=A0A0A8ZL58_ARUDO